MMIQTDGGNSFNIGRQFPLMFFKKSSNKSTKTGINMKPNFVLECKFGHISYGIDDSVRIVGVWSIDGNGIAIDQGLHVSEIGFIVFVKSGFSNLDVEVVGAFVDSSVDSVGYNSVLKNEYILGLYFL